MKRLILILCIWCSEYASANDLVIDSASLANLEQRTEQIQTVDNYLGQQILAVVKPLPGQSYVFTSPMNVQRLIYLKNDGTNLKKGDPIVQLIGPEVHHFYTQYKLYQQLYGQSEKLFNNNKTLFEKKSIDEGSWLEISEKHFQLRLILDEYKHFFEHVVKVDESTETIIVGAPVSGLISYSPSKEVKVNDKLADIIPEESLRLEFNVPINRQGEIVSVIANKCELALDYITDKASNLLKSAYTKALVKHCELVLGEQIIITPRYKVNAYSVSQNAVFNWHGKAHVFVAINDGFEAKQITIISGRNDKYIVSSDLPLDNTNVLVSSVSAAQGILMGLGE